MISETNAGPGGRAPEPDSPEAVATLPDGPAPEPGVSHYLRHYFGPLLLFLFLLRMTTTVAWLGLLMPIPIDLTFPEGAVVSRAFDATQGLPVYQDWRQWPHAFAPYGPLTYYPVGWAARLIEHATPRDIYDLGRSQSMICILALCVILTWMSRRVGMPRVWWLIPAALLLSWDHPLSFIVSYRPDAPAVMFSLLGLALMLGGPPTRRRMAAVFLALSLSMWFKMLAWGMIATAIWWVWRERGWKRTIAPMAVFGGANLLLATALNFALGGRLFLNLIDSLDNGVDFTNWVRFYLNLFNLDAEELKLDPFPIPKLILITGVAYAIRRLVKGGARQPKGPLWVGMVATWTSATLLGLKEGADINYYVETFAVASMVAASFAHALWAGGVSFRPRRREVLVGGVVLLVLFLSLLSYGWREAFVGPVGLEADPHALAKWWGKALVGAVIFLISFLILSRRGWREALVVGLILPLFIVENWYALHSIRDDLRAVKKMWGEPAFAINLRMIKGELLTGNPFLAMIRPAPPTVMDHVQYRILIDRGKIDPQILRDKIRRQDFDAIIFASKEIEIENPTWLQEETVRLIYHYYYVSEPERIANVTTLRPKLSPGFPRASRPGPG